MTGWLSFTAAAIQDGFGNLLAAGTLELVPTDDNDTPINAIVGSSAGGLMQNLQPSILPITNGAIPAGSQIPDTALTQPAGISFRITIKNAAGLPLNIVPGVQPSSVNGATFDLDTYQPNVGTQAVAVVGPQGVTAITGGTVDNATIGATTPAAATFTTLAVDNPGGGSSGLGGSIPVALANLFAPALAAGHRVYVALGSAFTEYGCGLLAWVSSATASLSFFLLDTYSSASPIHIAGSSLSTSNPAIVNNGAASNTLGPQCPSNMGLAVNPTANCGFTTDGGLVLKDTTNGHTYALHMVNGGLTTTTLS